MMIDPNEDAKKKQIPKKTNVKPFVKVIKLVVFIALLHHAKAASKSDMLFEPSWLFFHLGFGLWLF